MKPAFIGSICSDSSIRSERNVYDESVVQATILNTLNAENIGISVEGLGRVENPDTFKIDTSRTRQTISADTTPKTIQ